MEEGFVCFKCEERFEGSNDSVSHDCFIGVDEIYIVDGVVYPYNPDVINDGEASVQSKWTPELISVLLDIRLSKQNQFRAPQCKKKKMWMEVADEFYKLTNVEVSYDMADSKFRNLLATYRLNKKRRLHDPSAVVTWEYYDVMDAVLGHGLAYKPKPKETLEDILNRATAKEFVEDDLKVKWTSNLITCLLDLRLSRELEFAKPGCKKKKLWLTISRELFELTGVNISYDLCDIKFRNLLATYRVNKRRQLHEEDTEITWEYFTKFDEALKYKADLEAESADDPQDGSTSPASPSTSKRFKREKRCFSDSYVEYMMKKEDERLKRREIMWKEKRQLKEKEIEAIFALAKAIGSLSNSPLLTGAKSK